MMSRSGPITGGVALALGAALAFGVTTPVVAWATKGTGAIAGACLLYVGAGLGALVFRLIRRSDDTPVRRADVPRLIMIALAGGAIGPVLLVWGLQRSGATVGSLVLDLEAVFTIALARLAYREPIGSRVGVAVAVMTMGGAVLALDAWTTSAWSVAGVIALVLATLAWATDNILTRPLADRDPLEVVAAKGLLGAACTGVVVLATGDRFPRPLEIAVLLACGATGYGLSLRLYMLAQRRIGAGRTGSVFALAPFVGAALAYALGDRAASGWTLLAAGLFGTGVVLHATERHCHRHVHPAVEHEHVHRHDDAHHAHVHEPPVEGEHSHVHRHELIEHTHDHAPDLHHEHAH